MILAHLLLQSGATVLEYRTMVPEPVAVECVVRTENLSSRERHALEILVERMRQGSARHTIGTIRDLLGGTVPRYEFLPDHLRIAISAEVGGASNALSVLAGLFAAMPLDTLNLQSLELARTNRAEFSPWLSPILGPRDVRPMTQAEVRQIQDKLIRPQNMVIVVSGTGAADNVIETWRSHESTWTLKSGSGFSLSSTEQPVPTPWHGIILRGETQPWSPELLLATATLTLGKGSLTFETWRQTEGWSYRLEGGLVSVPGGFSPVIWAIQNEPSEDAIDPWIRALLTRIDKLSEKDRQRALGALRGSWSGTIPYGLFVSGADQTTSSSTNDRAYRSAIWFLKTRSAFDETTILRSLESISVDELKLACQKIVTGLTGRVYRD